MVARRARYLWSYRDDPEHPVPTRRPARCDHRGRGWWRAIPLVLVVLLGLGACEDAELPLESPAPGHSPTAGAAAAGDDRAGPVMGIPEIVQEVAPSVVAIEVEASARGRTVRGIGSGVIYASDGVIVTNAHVVAEASDVVVLLASGERIDGELVAADVRSDLAVVRVDADGLPAATFSDELPDVGELAVAMGSPLGLENSVTAGIVSAVERSVPVPGGTVLTGLIQTDASISPGNSGGALVGGDAAVMAINVAKAGGQQGAEGVGFAVPAATVRNVVEQLLEDGRVTHPFIGIRGATLSPQAAERFGFERERGVVVAAVAPDGPADAAGIRPGDLIVGMGGEAVDDLGDLLAELRRHDPGDTVDVVIVREGEDRAHEVTIGELPS